jgi:hypothetical protein
VDVPSVYTIIVFEQHIHAEFYRRKQAHKTF